RRTRRARCSASGTPRSVVSIRATSRTMPIFFFSSRRRHTRSVSAFLLNRSSDLSGDSSKKFKIAEGQWCRYAPSYVSPAYHLLEGFPFIQEPPSGDLQERVLIRHHDYDQCFQSVQLLQWNSQVKFNVTVYRNLPTTRDSIMTS